MFLLMFVCSQGGLHLDGAGLLSTGVICLRKDGGLHSEGGRGSARESCLHPGGEQTGRPPQYT